MASSITIEEFKLFHAIDRTIYARLVFHLKLDPNICKKILGFWLWVENNIRCCYFIRDLVYLADKWLHGIAKEAVTCINFMNAEPSSSDMAKIRYQLPFSSAMISPSLSLLFLYRIGEDVKSKVEKIVQDVCEKAFSDVVVVGPHVLLNSDLKLNQFLLEYIRHAFSDNDRTLFITFSDGCPTSRLQLEHFLERILGNSVEEICAKTEEPYIRFAGVLVKSPEAIRGILGGSEVAYLWVDGTEFTVIH